MGLFGIRDIDLPAIVPHSSLLLGSLLCISGILLFHYFVPNVDPHEPPIIRQRIPYFGHVVGLLRYGLGYFDVISARQPHPIFTVSLLGQKTYVATSPELVREIQRNTKTISFNPAMIPAFQRMLGTDQDGMDLIFKDAHNESGFYGEIHSIHKASLLPGTASLEQLSNGVRSKLMVDLNNIQSPRSIKLYAWVKDLSMRSNNTVCFGKRDPFGKYPGLDIVFWEFVQNLSVLVLGIPWVLAPKSHTAAHRARQELVDVFYEYLEEGGAQDSCSFIYDLCQLSIRRGLSNRNTARALVGSILAIVGNTIPTMFWILGHIYSDASLLTAIRQELEATLPQDMMSQPSKVEVDVAAIREKCPLFMSSYEEVLRMTAGIATVRYTMSDTMINNRWLLKKDATIQMPTAFIHADPNTWGSDANIFNPKRFVNTKSLPQDQRSKRNTAFRPFGGGNTLCPGRYFAFHEIISFVATIMLGFEMKPAGGVWSLPEKDKSKLPITSLKPRTDIELMIQRRKGWESLMFE